MAGTIKQKIGHSCIRLASRNVNSNSSASNFNVRKINSSGSVNNNNLYNVNSDGTTNTNSNSNGVRPVASINLGYIKYGGIREKYKQTMSFTIKV